MITEKDILFENTSKNRNMFTFSTKVIIIKVTTTTRSVGDEIP